MYMTEQNIRNFCISFIKSSSKTLKNPRAFTRGSSTDVIKLLYEKNSKI